MVRVPQRANGIHLAESCVMADPSPFCIHLATNMAYNAQFAVSGNPSVCRYLNPPPGTDPNSLNCVIEICPHQDVTSLYVDLFGTAYGQIKSVCTNTGNQDGGGQLDTNQGYRMLVRNNPNFFQQKKRSVERKDRRSRLRAEENALEKRASSVSLTVGTDSFPQDHCFPNR